MSSLSMFKGLSLLDELEEKDSPSTVEVEANVRVEVAEEQAAEDAVEELSEEIEEVDETVQEDTELMLRLLSYQAQIKTHGLSRSSYAAMNYDGTMDRLMQVSNNKVVSLEGINTAPTMDSTATICVEAISDVLARWKENFMKFLAWLRQKMKELWAKITDVYYRRAESLNKVANRLQKSEVFKADAKFKGLTSAKIQKMNKDLINIVKAFQTSTDNNKVINTIEALLKELTFEEMTLSSAGYSNADKLIFDIETLKKRFTDISVEKNNFSKVEAEIKAAEAELKKADQQDQFKNDELAKKQKDLTERRKAIEASAKAFGALYQSVMNAANAALSGKADKVEEKKEEKK